MREFDKLEEAEEIRELLRQHVRRPPAEVTFAGDTERMLPELFGGLSVPLPGRASGHRPKIDQPNDHRLGAFVRVVQVDLLTACKGRAISAATARSQIVSH
jgi:hypothetical protein